MGFARARFRIQGASGQVSGEALVDTGALMTVVDEALSSSLGLRPTGRTIRLTTLSGHEVICKEALSELLELEGETLLAERVAVCALPEQVKEKLRELGVHEGILIGTITLEAAGFVVDPVTGRLRRVGWLALGP